MLALLLGLLLLLVVLLLLLFQLHPVKSRGGTKAPI
jgi:hypothetical protein